MTALVSVFNFFIVYLDFLFLVFVGGTFRVSSFATPEQQEIARIFLETASNGQFHSYIHSDGIPLLLIPIGVFVLGAVIGLVRRLIRG